MDKDCPYYSIDAIFNQKNYWINMDETRPIEDISLEFTNDTNGEWEYVMIKNDGNKEDDDDVMGDAQS